MNTTYAIVDNDTFVLRYMQLLLKSRLPENFVCAWMCSSAKQAIHRCVTENTPDVLLVDMSMREMSGVDVIKAIRERNSNIVLIGITSYMLDEYVLQVAKSGGQALVHKDNLADVVAAIQSREYNASVKMTYTSSLIRISLDSHRHLHKLPPSFAFC